MRLQPALPRRPPTQQRRRGWLRNRVWFLPISAVLSLPTEHAEPPRHGHHQETQSRSKSAFYRPGSRESLSAHHSGGRGSLGTRESPIRCVRRRDRSRLLWRVCHPHRLIPTAASCCWAACCLLLRRLLVSAVIPVSRQMAVISGCVVLYADNFPLVSMTAGSGVVPFDDPFTLRATSRRAGRP